MRERLRLLHAIVTACLYEYIIYALVPCAAHKSTHLDSIPMLFNPRAL